MSTNFPGFEDQEIFKCKEGDTDEDIKTLVEVFVVKLTLISEKRFDILREKYSDIINSLD